MPKRLTKDEFILKSKIVHRDKFDYSKVEYINSHTPVEIGCPIHGCFKQLPYHHYNGIGCPKCKADKHRKPNYGVGINDIYGESGWHPIYRMWNGVIRRCFDNEFKAKQPTYMDCKLYPEWIYYSKFKEWALLPENNYQEGMVIDKDILIKGNKVYSPETCCLVPQRINTLIIKCDKNRGKYPIGVSKNGNRFSAILERKFIGNFNTPEEAFFVYKQAKEKLIKEVAIDYYNRGEITEKVYNALINYKVEITD